MEEKKDLTSWIEEGVEAAADMINEVTGTLYSKARYESAKQIYAAAGVDTEAAINKLKEVPVSVSDFIVPQYQKRGMFNIRKIHDAFFLLCRQKIPVKLQREL